MTPTPTPDVSAEQRESDAAFVERMAKRGTFRSHAIIDEFDFDHLVTIARRATTPAPQREGDYKAGLLRAAEIADGWINQACSLDIDNPGDAIRAEAAAPNLTATRVVEQGEPVAGHSHHMDQCDAGKESNEWFDGIIEGLGRHRAFCHQDSGTLFERDGCYRVLWYHSQPLAVSLIVRDDRNYSRLFRWGGLYAAPPAPVPAGEVTELIKNVDALLERDGVKSSHMLIKCRNMLVALTAARPRADAGVTEAMVHAAAESMADHDWTGWQLDEIREFLRAALAARMATSAPEEAGKAEGE